MGYCSVAHPGLNVYRSYLACRSCGFVVEELIVTTDAGLSIENKPAWVFVEMYEDSVCGRKYCYVLPQTSATHLDYAVHS